MLSPANRLLGSPWLEEIMPTLSIGLELPRSTSSAQSLGWALEQIRQCRTSHKTCNQPTTTLLPKRVLDVQAGPNSGICLYEPDCKAAPYVCLSHCWGRQPFLCTRSENVESHKSGIDLGHLPPTFRDAIQVTRRLGIRYLWIDSLCIIQDSTDDWRQEAAKMASIYQNSALVISSSKSDDAYGGLYAEFAEEHKAHTIALRTTDTSSESIHVRLALTHNQRLERKYGLESQTLTPIFTRGWVFQERFLSPRVLHFGPEELAWECFEASTCQCRLTQEIPGTGWHNSSNRKLYYCPATWQTMGPRGLAIAWTQLIEDYTRLTLTYDKDIFPAISGLAKEFQKVVKSEYLAGLWRHSLFDDLLWHFDDAVLYTPSLKHHCENWMKGPKSWRAPSWSWASVKAPVVFLRSSDNLVPECEVLEAICELAGPDPTGELAVGGSYLVMRGHLLPGTMRVSNRDARTWQRHYWTQISLDVFAGHLVYIWADYDCEDVLKPTATSTSNADRIDILEGLQNAEVQVFFLLLGRLPAHGGGDVFLILFPATEQTNNNGGIGGDSFRRIGIVSVSRGGSSAMDWRAKLLAEAEVRII